jgi:hypothetical protein
VDDHQGVSHMAERDALAEWLRAQATTMEGLADDDTDPHGARITHAKKLRRAADLLQVMT